MPTPEPPKETATSEPVPTITKKFTLFPTLAIELRQKIWRHAINLSPRIVELCEDRGDRVYSPIRKYTKLENTFPIDSQITRIDWCKIEDEGGRDAGGEFGYEGPGDWAEKHEGEGKVGDVSVAETMADGTEVKGLGVEGLKIEGMAFEEDGIQEQEVEQEELYEADKLLQEDRFDGDGSVKDETVIKEVKIKQQEGIEPDEKFGRQQNIKDEVTIAEDEVREHRTFEPVRPNLNHLQGNQTNYTFYSPTPLSPLLLGINKESRAMALTAYTLSFPNLLGHDPARTWFNTEIDTLYFPSWCFDSNLDAFERASSQETKDGIKRIARDFLVTYWIPMWDEGTVNNQINVVQFGRLEELVLVDRLKGPMGCGCCHQWRGLEEGVASFEFRDDGEESQAAESEGEDVAVEALEDSVIRDKDEGLGELDLEKLQLVQLTANELEEKSRLEGVEQERVRDERLAAIIPGVQQDQAVVVQQSINHGDRKLYDDMLELEKIEEVRIAAGESESEESDASEGLTTRQEIERVLRGIARMQKRKGLAWSVPELRFAWLLRNGVRV